MRKFLIGLFAVAAAVYLWNASWLAARPADPAVKLIAHRGVHQTFDRAGVEKDTCTATRIFPPEHDFIENTVPSMRAAFEAGADVVEIDVHPTTDGKFAVIHDWTLDCRTDGAGVTREHDMAFLKTLDIGYGYTADGGATHPLRGKGIGLMPSLDEVFEAFPDGRFLINYKSREAREGDMLAAMLADRPDWRGRVWGVYGGDAPTDRAATLVDGLKGFGSRAVKDCLVRYLAFGWTGHVPEACRNTYVMVPINYAWLMWGWPDRFHARMAANGSEIILLGPYSGGDTGTSGIDTPEDLARVPAHFDGYVWTNRIETIGPMLKAD
ncbi:glycerophosphodiester phosphodiesterase family protein [Chelativorans salis]|uniref:Glycerophosphodiester phosphodiesterase family protein n=1 Tax=Chelativorans salis TaxID=2978478 RepID=A0ABT2LPV3_9HYPH|nr:glycerophosphodiester phosphodiesterase family protein [Chelativorans sp. EGI FJ00035]MCT7376581.1 glycerophosphodiester phosphodiesterase family protein [Chelativorans sp. EGI FJ00035]